MDQKTREMIETQLGNIASAMDDVRKGVQTVARLAGVQIPESSNPDALVGDRSPPIEYRPDGFSVKISPHGARRHRAVDEAVSELLERGDLEAAKSVPVWFVFGDWSNPDPAVELWPMEGDPRREIVQFAVDEVGGEWVIFAGYRSTPWFQPFRVARDDYHPIHQSRRFNVIESHSVVMLHRGWTPARAMELHAKKILAPKAPSPEPDPPGTVRPVVSQGPRG